MPARTEKSCNSIIGYLLNDFSKLLIGTKDLSFSEYSVHFIPSSMFHTSLKIQSLHPIHLPSDLLSPGTRSPQHHHPTHPRESQLRQQRKGHEEDQQDGRQEQPALQVQASGCGQWPAG